MREREKETRRKIEEKKKRKKYTREKQKKSNEVGLYLIKNTSSLSLADTPHKTTHVARDPPARRRRDENALLFPESGFGEASFSFLFLFLLFLLFPLVLCVCV